MAANGGQFFLADEAHPANRAIDLGLDQSDEDLSIGLALFQ